MPKTQRPATLLRCHAAHYYLPTSRKQLAQLSHTPSPTCALQMVMITNSSLLGTTFRDYHRRERNRLGLLRRLPRPSNCPPSARAGGVNIRARRWIRDGSPGLDTPPTPPQRTMLQTAHVVGWIPGTRHNSAGRVPIFNGQIATALQGPGPRKVVPPHLRCILRHR